MIGESAVKFSPPVYFLHLHTTILHMTRALVSTINLYNRDQCVTKMFHRWV
jgi:hypothetical protein